ncbi:MAG: hypothetical protein DI585_04960 [Pseudomonas fluorescens]|nr:MAG: hypothetical protein DI585_04960 [Pseudomonas fluorescens]
MDIRALSQFAGGNTSAVALSVPVDTRAFISEVASSGSLTDAERSGLISAVALADSTLTGGARAQVVQQIQSLGLYLRNTGNSGFPRWTMMTALRSYGMNLSAEQAESGAMAAIQQKMQQAVQGRGVSVEAAIAAARSAPVMTEAPRQAPVTQQVKPSTPVDTGTRVEKIA